MEKIYILYEQAMYRVAYSILNSRYAAEDAVSEACIKIAENINKIDDVKSDTTKHYIIKIIKNTSINIYRKNKLEASRTEGENDYQGLDDSKSQEGYKYVESHTVLEQMLEGLSDRYQDIVIMRCIQEMSFSEIAQVLHEKPATVRKQFERAKKELKKRSEKTNQKLITD